MTLKSFFAVVGALFTAFFAGVISFLFVDRLKTKKPAEKEIPPEQIKKESEEVREEKENEIKNTDSSDLIKSSDNYSDIQSGIEKLQSDSTGRIRDRLKEKL